MAGADIVSIKGEPVSIGEIDKQGEFTISLNHKIIDEFQKRWKQLTVILSLEVLGL